MFTWTYRIINAYMNRIMDNVLNHPSHVDLRITASLLLGLGVPFGGIYFYATAVRGESFAGFLANEEAGAAIIVAVCAYELTTLFFGATLPWYFTESGGRE